MCVISGKVTNSVPVQNPEAISTPKIKTEPSIPVTPYQNGFTNDVTNSTTTPQSPPLEQTTSTNLAGQKSLAPAKINGTTSSVTDTQFLASPPPTPNVKIQTPQPTSTNLLSNWTNAQPRIAEKQGQMDISTFLLEEIRTLREDHKRLYQEVLSLKMENMRLSCKLDNCLGTVPTPDTSSLRGMVLFDLLKKPAIVLTANDTFCQMLGYEMWEVVGMPWHQFIHKDYVERTLSILSQRSMQDSCISFEQVYKHKDNGIFVALDTHRIFFANGEPVSDLVYIELTDSSTKLPSPQSR